MSLPLPAKTKPAANGKATERTRSFVEAIREDGGEAIAVSGDVTEETTHIRLVEAALKQFGGSQSLYNSLHFEGTDNVENFAPTLALVQHENGDLEPSASTSLVVQQPGRH